MSNRVGFVYLRDRNGNPVGGVSFVVGDGVVNFAISVQNPADKFNRHAARGISESRLSKSGFSVSMPHYYNEKSIDTNEVIRCIMTRIAGGRSYENTVNTSHFPTRAIKSAKNWLRNPAKKA